MTPTAQALRLVGALITVFAAWYHSPLGIAAGLVLILAALLYGPSAPHVTRTNPAAGLNLALGAADRHQNP